MPVSLALWAASFGRFNRLELVIQLRSILRGNDPEALCVETVVLMHDSIPLGDHISPWEPGIAVAKFGRQRPCRLAVDCKVVRDRLLGNSVSCEGRWLALCEVSYVRESCAHISKAVNVAVLAQSGTASRSIRPRVGSRA